ncbi:tumor necrosis factor receptor superfamily member wengen [Cephus cinctus]|uniref:Tumor necrosis factor receptor superfamily member wengen n=1 Tax=Cephus cinctus TaxID=211228 RepID=A0AAJ7RHM7_CEPCN|nr:tumor necrosis factor receptor superfamily member wengen [Cephus cinctus]
MPREPYPGLLGVTLVLFGSLSSTAWSTTDGQTLICEPSLEFWSTDNARCMPCTKCAPEFTLSPCAVHKDAICGPLSALELDWSFLTSRKRPESGRRIDAVTSKMVWRFPEIEEQLRVAEETKDLEGLTAEDSGEEFIEEFASAENKRVHERRRSSGESNIPWDWQTGALVLAVCACIVFFLVAGCSALIYARQWRRMKRNFEPAGLEEISARLNLMVKAELAELTAGTSMSSSDPETRCQYLEKLLDRKRETPMVAGWPDEGGNLYIEEGETPRTKRAQIAQIHRNIESILSHKSIRD